MQRFFARYRPLLKQHVVHVGGVWRMHNSLGRQLCVCRARAAQELTEYVAAPACEACCECWLLCECWPGRGSDGAMAMADAEDDGGAEDLTWLILWQHVEAVSDWGG